MSSVQWTQIGDARLGLGDFRDALAEIGAVDCVVTDS